MTSLNCRKRSSAHVLSLPLNINIYSRHRVYTNNSCSLLFPVFSHLSLSGCRPRLNCQPVCACVRAFVCVYLLKAHTWSLIGKSDVQDVQPGATRTHTAARSLFSLTLVFLPKSTPDVDIVMCNPSGWQAHCCDCGFTLSIFSPTTHVFADLPVCPACSLHSRTKKGQGCWRKTLFVLPLRTCKHSQTQRQTTELWGKYGSCLFYVVVAVLLSDIFSLAH